MRNSIYKTSDCGDMTEDDMISWLKTFKMFDPQYKNWSFEDIAGV